MIDVCALVRKSSSCLICLLIRHGGGAFLIVVWDFFNSLAESQRALTRAVCHQPNCQLKFDSWLWMVRAEVRINGRDFGFPQCWFPCAVANNSPKGNYLGANTTLDSYSWHYVPSAKPWPWDKESCRAWDPWSLHAKNTKCLMNLARDPISRPPAVPFDVRYLSMRVEPLP